MAFPYAPRAGQPRLLQAMQDAMAGGGHLLADAGTGLGKTIVALTAAATRDGGRLIYATRTNSQQVQVQREAAVLADAGHPLGLVPLMGRSHYCPLLRDDARFAGATSEELGRLCRKAKQAALIEHETGQGREGACPYYAGLLRDGPGPVAALLETGLAGDQLAARVAAAGSCPYEAVKLLLADAPGVILPAVFLIDDGLRGALTTWLGTGLDDCHIVIDEAHHLPGSARDHHSPRLGTGTLTRAHKEAMQAGDPELAPGVRATTVVEAMTRTLHMLAAEAAANRGSDDDADALLAPDAVHVALLARLGVPSPVLTRLAAALQDMGAAIRDEQASKGRLPRSYLGAVGDFLAFWMGRQDLPYVHLIHTGARPALEAYLLDPGAVLGWMQEAASTIQMSGTLAPLDAHRRQCALPADTQTQQVPSPFDPRHLRIIGVEGVHRRWQAHRDDPTHAERLQAAARTCLAALPGRTGIFFPSHQSLADYVEEGFLHGVARRVYQEAAGMGHGETMAMLGEFLASDDPGALLLGVMGGRLTEGIDLPGDALANVILMGIPYPRPSARQEALMRRAEQQGDGAWQTVIHAPVARTLRQTIGRLIRGPDDRGTAVILDERVVRFHADLPGLTMVSSAAAITATSPPWDGGAVTASTGFQAARRHDK